MKKIIIGVMIVISFVFVMKISCVQSQNIMGNETSQEENCEQLNWTLENGILIISGSIDKDGQGTGGQAIGAIISNGKIISNYSHSQYGGGIIGFTNDNKLYLGKISAEEAINMGIRDAVEFGPFLIVNGKSAFINGNGGYGIHPRSAIAQRKDGIVLFLVIDGRSLKSKGADMNDLVDILLRYHAYNASNLDGGNSSALVIDNKIVNHPINWDNLEQTRPIPCGFIVKE